LYQKISFCNDIINKETKVVKELAHKIADQGKYKTDTAIDEVRAITYLNFTSSIEQVLTSDIKGWMELSFFDFGVYLGTRLKTKYHTEGGSRNKLYIVIHSDNNEERRLVNSSLLQQYIKEAAQSCFFKSTHWNVMHQLFIECSRFETILVEEKLHYFEYPSIDKTQDLMRGIVSL